MKIDEKLDEMQRMRTIEWFGEKIQIELRSVLSW